MQQELRERRHWQEVALACLDEPTVEHYLTLHFSGATTVSLAALAHTIHQRTEGHPLFLVSLVEDLHAQQMLVQTEEQWHLRVPLQDVASHIPATLSATLAGQFQGLQPEEQTTLEAASVAGLHFTVPVVSAATGKSLLEAEEICENLARRERFISRDGIEEWPDTTLATRYRFRHALHQDVAYQRIPPLKRLHWHQQIGERREHAFASEVGTVAVELAVHFEQSRDYERAVRYLQMASAQAVRRSAYSEARSLASKGLALLDLLPASPQRTQMEMTLHVVFAVSVTTTIGGGMPEVQQACYRALELCRQADDDLQLFPILSVLFGFYFVSAQFQTAREVAERLLRLAEQQSEPVLKLAAHLTLAVVLWQMGELSAARVHFEQRQRLYTPHDHLKFLQFGHDPTVTSLAFAAPALWLLGYPEQARRAGLEAVALAAQLEYPYTHAVTLHFVSHVFHGLRELPIIQTQTEAELALSREQDTREGIALGMIMQGWIWAQHGHAQEAIVQIREGIGLCDVIGTQMDRSYHLTVLAEAYALNDQPDDGLVVLEDALQYGEKTGGRHYEAEIYRLRGELTLQQKSQKSKVKNQKSKIPSPQHRAPSTQAEVVREVEESFLKAIDIACKQSAKSWELRATMSLVRLRQQQAVGQRAKSREHGAGSANRARRSTHNVS